ncbi:MAG: DUF2029 domain-containing protein [Rhodobacteraceae bacterium]|nr:DUF2029 domain-containing protein [Paracoccaceae bacterium]
MSRRADIWFSTLLGILFTVFTLMIVAGHMPSDIQSPYLAGWFFGTGQMDQIYSADVREMFNSAPSAEWYRAAKERGSDTTNLYPFLYPPIWAAAMVPIAKSIDIPTFVQVAYLIQIPAIYGSIFLAWKLAGKPGSFFVWAAFSVTAVIVTLIGFIAIVENQPQMLIIFLILFGLERLMNGNGRLAGVVLGIVATIKIFPVFLILLMLARRDWRAAGYMAATGMIVLAASFLVAGPALHWEFLAQLRSAGSTIFLGQNNLNISTFLLKLQHLIPVTGMNYSDTVMTVGKPLWISVVSLVVLVGGTFLIVARFRHNPSYFLILAFLMLLGFCSPFGWPYYYLPLVFFWPGIFTILSLRSSILLTYLVFTPFLMIDMKILSSFELSDMAFLMRCIVIALSICGFIWLGWSKRPDPASNDVAP